MEAKQPVRSSARFGRRQLFTRAAPLGLAGTMFGTLAPAVHAAPQTTEHEDALSVGAARLAPNASGGVQFTTVIPAHSSRRFFTYGWPYNRPVLWTLLPVDAPLPDAELLSLTNVATTSSVDGGGNRTIVYWLTIVNNGNADHSVRGIFVRFDEVSV